jgi:hypothetical protein
MSDNDRTVAMFSCEVDSEDYMLWASVSTDTEGEPHDVVVQVFERPDGKPSREDVCRFLEDMLAIVRDPARPWPLSAGHFPPPDSDPNARAGQG